MPESSDRVDNVVARGVSPEYFRAMAIPLRRGRFFDNRDKQDAIRVCIVNEVLVRRYFGNEDPIGERIMGRAGQDWLPEFDRMKNQHIIRKPVFYALICDSKIESIIDFKVFNGWNYARALLLTSNALPYPGDRRIEEQPCCEHRQCEGQRFVFVSTETLCELHNVHYDS